jgi:PleD family two-component response regulator
LAGSSAGKDEAARNAVSQRELRIELARLSNQWTQQATQDPLTGLGNRRALDHWLGLALSRTAQGEPLVLVLMDLDHFKQVNDRFGHDIAAAVLRHAAQLMHQTAWALQLRLESRMRPISKPTQAARRSRL